MVDLKKVIAEARPMLEDFLCNTGLYRAGDPLDLRFLLGPFSEWIDAQQVTEEDRFYLASRLAAGSASFPVNAS